MSAKYGMTTPLQPSKSHFPWLPILRARYNICRASLVLADASDTLPPSDLRSENLDGGLKHFSK